MERRNLILGAIAVALISVAAVYTFTRSGGAARIPQEIQVNCGCLACRQHVRVSAGVMDPCPYVCPVCGERAAYPLMVCRNCGAHFVPNLVRRPGLELPAMPVVPVCPVCGQANAGAYAGTETIPPEELVLPAWPQ